MMGEEAVVVRSSEAGSETGGGDGAIGASGCAPSVPTALWSPTFREVSEAVVGAMVFWAAVMRAFLMARSAVLESRFAVGVRLRVPASGARGAMAAPVLTGMSTSMSSKSIGRLKQKEEERSISMRKIAEGKIKRQRLTRRFWVLPLAFRSAEEGCSVGN